MAQIETKIQLPGRCQRLICGAGRELLRVSPPFGNTPVGNLVGKTLSNEPAKINLAG